MRYVNFSSDLEYILGHIIKAGSQRLPAFIYTPSSTNYSSTGSPFRLNILSRNINRRPMSSNPTKSSSAAPGVNGVMRAIKPTNTSKPPTTFFSLGLVKVKFLAFSYMLCLR